MVRIRFSNPKSTFVISSSSVQSPLVYYKDQNENVESKLHIKSASVAKKVNIRRLNINANLKANIKQLFDGIDGITARLNQLRKNTVRHKRFAEQTIDTVNVKRLNIPKDQFESKCFFVIPGMLVGVK